MQYVLYLYISTSHSLSAVHNMAGLFNSSISCFLGMVLRYCVGDFEMVPFAMLLAVSLFLSRSTSSEFLLQGPNILKFLFFSQFSLY